MTLFKRFHIFLFAAVIFSGTVYYLGCSSAESTTGKLAFNQKDFPKAEMELKKGLMTDKNDDEGWYMLGYSQIELEKYEDAQNSFKTCLSISNNYADMIKAFWIEKYNNGAKSYANGIDAEEKKNPSGARNFYTDALKSFTASAYIIPDSLKSYSAMGEAYLALGQQDKALEIFKDIASKSKSQGDAERAAKIIFESGLNMISLNNYKAAFETFKEVTTIPSLPKDDPYYETAMYNCALSLAKTGEEMRSTDEKSNYKEKFSEALGYLEPLTVSLKKKDLEPQIYELLVSVYANLGMTDKAQESLKKMESLKK